MRLRTTALTRGERAIARAAVTAAVIGSVLMGTGIGHSVSVVSLDRGAWGVYAGPVAVEYDPVTGVDVWACGAESGMPWAEYRCPLRRPWSWSGRLLTGEQRSALIAQVTTARLQEAAHHG